MTLAKKPASRLLHHLALALSLAAFTTTASLNATEVPENEQPDDATKPTKTAPSADKATLPTAENIDLSKPVVEPVPTAPKTTVPDTDAKDKTPKESTEGSTTSAPTSPVEPKRTPQNNGAPDAVEDTHTIKTPAATSTAASEHPEKEAAQPEEKPVEETANTEPTEQQPEDDTWVFLDTVIMKGSTTRLSWSPDQSFEGIETPTPVLIAHGAKPGPKLCLTAALHGDELNGIEIVRRVLYNIDASELAGTVIGVPIVNLQGFHRSSRYLTDRRDLNRFFPGNPTGSSASRIAHSFFQRVISHCDLLVDLHTGSFYRTNLPQLRANLRSPEVVALTKNFDAIVVLHSEGAQGTLRRSAVDAGIPAVTLEAGGPMELNEDYVEQGVKAINTLLDKNGMLTTISFWGTPQPTFYRSQWVRTDHGGILFSDIKLGGKVRKGDLLGVVTDPITNFREEIISPVNGRVIGMAVNQVVLPGFAAYHIGITPRTVNQYDEKTPPPVSEEIHEEDARID